MKKIAFFTTVLTSFIFSGCSNFILDVSSLMKDKSYTVRHLKEVKAEYDENGIQTNVEEDEDGNIILSYEEADVETLKGAPGEETNASVKKYEGFTALAFDQQTILEDGTTVVEIKYNRVESTISFNPNGGLWDFDSSKTDKEIKSYTRKYGSALPEIPAAGLGKRLCTFTGWKDPDGNIISVLPETFPVENVTYTADWENNGGSAWKIRYLFEPSDSTDSEALSAYKTDDSHPDEVQYGQAGETTIVHVAEDSDGSETEVIAAPFDGFTLAASIEQKTVAADGSTVVKVYYKRNEYTVSLYAGKYEDTDGVWNYQAVKAGTEEAYKDTIQITAKYGSTVDYSAVSGAGIKGCVLSGWKNADGTVIENLPETMPYNGGEYTACWTKLDAVSYKVEHWFEKVSSTDSENLGNYEINKDYTQSDLKGYPEDMTVASAESAVGFTPLSITQEEIKADGSTIICIYYKRNEVTVTLSIADGYWNYAQWKADQKKSDDEKENIEPDSSDKTVSGKYGTAIEYGSLFANAGKKSSSVEKWQIDDTENYIENLPSVFPSGSVKYTAVWTTSGDVNYTVEHWFEKTTCTDITDESAVSYSKDEDYTETKKGTLETNTAAEARNVTGFTARQFKQQEIEASGNTVVKIYYVRNSIDLKFNPDEGIWNYDAWKADKSGVTPNQAEKTVSGKYGTVISYPDFSGLKKIGRNLSGFSYEDGEETRTVTVGQLKAMTEFPASGVSYTAVWTDKAQVGYTVRHWTEMVSSSDENDASNYELNGTDSTKKGIPEYYTEAAYKTITGFEPREAAVTQEEIAEDGSTVVNLYYKRSIYKITFESNGGIWNYADYKNNGAASDSENKVVQGKYGTTVTLPELSGLGKTSYNFAGWTSNGGTTAETLPSVYGASDLTYSAIWTLADGYKYTIKHLFQNVDATAYVENEALRETGAGVKDELTEAVPKTVTGFTAVTPVTQVTILADDSAVVEIKYTRNSSNFIFDPNGGTISGASTVSGLYESKFAAAGTPSASKTGWKLAGWKLNGVLVSDSNCQLKDQYYGASDVTYTAYWVAELSVGTVGSFGDISLVISDNTDESKYDCSVTLPSGLEAKEWSYKWYVDTVYTAEGSDFTRTYSSLGKGKHTITVKAVHNGNSFTKAKTVTVN